MDFSQDKKVAQEKLNPVKRTLPKLSIGLHTMPKTETGHFQKWLVLGLAAFVLIVIVILLVI